MPMTMADGGAIAAAEHRLAVRVYYEDTDAVGVVYHASYLRFAERARTEMLRCLGLEHDALRTRFGLAFTVRRCVVDYLAPARLDDRLEVRSRLARLRGASLELEQRILRGEQLLVRMDVRLALISSTLRAVRLPRALIDALAPLRHDPASNVAMRARETSGSRLTGANQAALGAKRGRPTAAGATELLVAAPALPISCRNRVAARRPNAHRIA
jgi:acyl-CoA thioester hydrolase